MGKHRKVSGKCCLEDTLEIWTQYNDNKLKKFLNRTSFYCDDITPKNKLCISNYKDIVPYLPRVESIAAFSKDGENTIILQKRPHWAYEETNRLENMYEDILKLYNRCKRKKIEFTKEYCIENSFYGKEYFQKYYNILLDRFLEFGKKMTFSDIHFETTNKLYREPFIEEMISEGYTKEQAYEWVYNENKTW